MTETRILLFLKLPPPLTGATLMNQIVTESNLLHEEYNIQLIPISYKSQINERRIIYSITIMVKLLIKLINSLIHFKPKIVYFQISPLGIAFYRDCIYVLIIKAFNKHIVFHLHGKGIKEETAVSKFKRDLYKWVFKNNSMICLSECLTSDIKDIYNDRPYIVNNGIPVDYAEINAPETKNEIFTILFLSNLIKSKGIYVFLDSLVILYKSHYLFKAYIVGNETELSAEKLQYELKTRDIDNFVTFLGSKYDKEKHKIIKSTDVLVYPTLNDVWGLVILEAMQYGIPVIASREGAIPEIVDDGITGFLVDKNSPEQIVEKLEVLRKDVLLRKKMGMNAQAKFLEKYTLDIFENRMKEVFDIVLEKIDKQTTTR